MILSQFSYKVLVEVEVKKDYTEYSTGVLFECGF